MPNTDRCPICVQSARCRWKEGVLGVLVVDCPACGQYEAGELEFLGLQDGPKPGYHRASALVRRHWDDTRQPLPFERRQLRDNAYDAPDVAVTQRIDRAISLIAQRSRALGAATVINLKADWPAVAASTPAELRAILEHLATTSMARIEFVTPGTTGDGMRGALTASGWAKAESLLQARSRTDQVFVAMSFSTGMTEVYDHGLAPGITDAGYVPLRVDRSQHNEKICDKIVAEIRRSGLIVADFTENKHGVYFEAGLAMGLGIPVIWSCREDQIGDVHFDTRQYNHITWKSPADLLIQIRDRLRALYPHS